MTKDLAHCRPDTWQKNLIQSELRQVVGLIVPRFMVDCSSPALLGEGREGMLYLDDDG